jgi:hypothetical protein
VPRDSKSISTTARMTTIQFETYGIDCGILVTIGCGTISPERKHPSTRTVESLLGARAPQDDRGSPRNFYFYFYFFLGWGKGGKCVMHLSALWAPCVGLQNGLPVGHFSRWTFCRLTYPLKPSHAGAARPHPIMRNRRSDPSWDRSRQNASRTRWS